ncbi:MAG: hypothetical protein ABF479_07835 [Gluconacetobacter sp.]|uniref:Uncharacterized protein n=1 Tax=Gluconacetobacter dulcium TaxID=2729096 RepID=A0A7W4PK47_9PROT|nr:hypothetical protein [Gluconacetobacter dulcium]MBB2197501.1 hypothetical protein [Gluconacetobacter dulcium]
MQASGKAVRDFRIGLRDGVDLLVRMENESGKGRKPHFSYEVDTVIRLKRLLMGGHVAGASRSHDLVIQLICSVPDEMMPCRLERQKIMPATGKSRWSRWIGSGDAPMQGACGARRQGRIAFLASAVPPYCF